MAIDFSLHLRSTWEQESRPLEYERKIHTLNLGYYWTWVPRVLLKHHLNDWLGHLSLQRCWQVGRRSEKLSNLLGKGPLDSLAVSNQALGLQEGNRSLCLQSLWWDWILDSIKLSILIHLESFFGCNKSFWEGLIFSELLWHQLWRGRRDWHNFGGCRQ